MPERGVFPVVKSDLVSYWLDWKKSLKWLNTGNLENSQWILSRAWTMWTQTWQCDYHQSWIISLDRAITYVILLSLPSRNKWWSSAAAWFWPSSWARSSTASLNKTPEWCCPPAESTQWGGRGLSSVHCHFNWVKAETDAANNPEYVKMISRWS